jgi:CheY-like chemotaxis protein
MMPVMNGQQFIEHTRLDPELAPIPVVIMSADGNLAEKAISLGSAYLAKPAGIETVLGTIARHCVAGEHASSADVTPLGHRHRIVGIGGGGLRS